MSFNISTAKLFGSSTVGVYLFSNNFVTLVPQDAPEKIDDLVRDVLKTDVVRTTIAGYPLLGIFAVGNDNGVVLPQIVKDDEVKVLKAMGLNVVVIETRYTALANLILVNNKQALVSPILERENVKRISDALNVEVFVDTICGSPLVGSIAVVNNRGVLVCPEATGEDLRKLKEHFNLYVDIGTVNRGRGFLRGGMVVNDNGAIVGDETTGIEMMRIQTTLGLRG